MMKVKATVSWRIIGGWVVELTKSGTPLPILDLVDIEALQRTLCSEWPACSVTHDSQFVASIVIHEVPYEGCMRLVNRLADIYPTHPATGDHIRWVVSRTTS